MDLQPRPVEQINDHTDYHITVTYRDGNFLWKDSSVAPEYVTDTAISSTEREVTCFVPTFWDGIPRFSHIQHVGYCVQGKTFQLPWTEARRDSTNPSALSMDVLLHFDPAGAPIAVEWNNRTVQETLG